jgi:hypothetical protein
MIYIKAPAHDQNIELSKGRRKTGISLTSEARRRRSVSSFVCRGLSWFSSELSLRAAPGLLEKDRRCGKWLAGV